MSISSINTRGPIDPAQAKSLATAREVKKNVLKTAQRFQSLDGQAPDLAKERDVVVVEGANKADLPQSMGNKLARLAVGVLADKDPEAKATGFSVKGKDGSLRRADILTEAPDGQKAEFQYKKLDDGSEIYHGPTSDGYAVIKENKKDGTLMMLTSEKPNYSAYQNASYWQAPAPDGAEAAPKPKTLSETLKEFASGGQAGGIGTHAGEVKEKAPASGFLAPFGEKTNAEAKPEAPSILSDVSETFSEAGKRLDETAKKTTRSVKDWSQSETAEKIGTVLFGKLNPFGKKG